MSDPIRARFLRKFLDGAHGRVSRGIEAVATGNAREAWGQLHALAGEAAMLGLPELAEAARAGSVAARRWLDADDGAARDACDRTLRAIGADVARLDEEERAAH
jgi:HPt (histidine-containing phosphotransfer) domain-containing protein